MKNIFYYYINKFIMSIDNQNLLLVLLLLIIFICLTMNQNRNSPKKLGIDLRKSKLSPEGKYLNNNFNQSYNKDSIQKLLPRPIDNLQRSSKNLNYDTINNFNKNSQLTNNLNYSEEIISELNNYSEINNQEDSISSEAIQSPNDIKINQESTDYSNNTQPSCLNTQFLPDLLNYPFTKLPTRSLNQQQCFKKEVDACPMSNYQQCTNNYPLKDYTTFDICNCNGFSTTNLCPYKLSKQDSNVNIKLKCPLYYNQVPYNLVLP